MQMENSSRKERKADSVQDTPPVYLRIGKRKVRVPRKRGTRITLGLWLTIGGALPIPPGYVFIPVGIAILSIDFPRLRRWRRRTTVKLGRRKQRQQLRKASKLPS